MKKLRVLQVGKFYPPFKGGMEDHLYHICNGLKAEYDLQVVVSNINSSTERETAQGIDVIKVGRLFELFSSSICPSMHSWIKKFRADIVHLHHPNPMGHLAYMLARPAGKLVVSWHSDIIKQKYLLKFYKPFLMNLLERADRIIATSPAYIEHSLFLNKFRDKCTVIPLGIDVDRFSVTAETEEAAAAIRRKYGERIVLFVGRLTYYKGMQYLIEAMKNTDATLLVIGEGSLKNELRRLVLNTGTSERIFFLKGVSNENIIDYYMACNVLVLPSVARSEAFGVVQLEAMACAKPVISTNLKTGVPWVNQNGLTGMVVPPEDPRSLADAINKLLASPELQRIYGENGQTRVEKEFARELVTKRISSLYKELL